MAQKQLTNEQVSSLCGALGHLIGSGISAGDSLLLLSQDEPDKSIAAVLEAGSRQADAGMPLSRILSDAGVFPPYVSALTASGEAVGQTENTLLTLASYYGQRAQLQRQLKTALVYPAVLLGVLAVVIGILLIFVLPVFNDVYISLGSGLTGFAAVLLQLGQILKHILPFLGVLLAVFGIILAVPLLREKAAAFFQKHMGDKGVLAQVNSARFLQTLSLGICCGMTDPEAAVLAASLADNPAFRARCDACLSALETGTPLPEALLDRGFLSRSQGRLLEAGIRSGHLDTVLEGLSSDALQRSEEALAAAAARLEPAMVIIACVMMGGVLLSVMLPLMNIMTALG